MNNITIQMVEDDKSFTITFSSELNVFDFYEKLDLLALSAGYQQGSIDDVYICKADSLNTGKFKNMDDVD